MDLSDLSHIFFSLITLTFLEIVLGVDNLVFIAIASSRLPLEKQKKARRLGLIFALVTRLLLLAFIVYLVGIKKPLFTLFTQSVSVRDLILMAGGLFLLIKATQEVYREMKPEEQKQLKPHFVSMFSVIMQIGILDIIFSLDSVFTAVGLTSQYWIMATAIIIAILTMIFLSEPLSALIQKYPTIKMLALSFLFLISGVLILDGLHFHVPREYVFLAISFSVFVEILNSLSRKK
jgi:predicted tellurium resistance membrane protein TerC